MAVVTPLEIPSIRNRISDEEWKARIDLAACYRLVAFHGWTDLILNHISLRVPGTEDQFLINPFGLLYDQITASSLVKIDIGGNVLQDSPYPINQAGFVIHGAIHRARPDLHCILHTHTVAGQAVSALDCGILPLHQSALQFYNRVGFHDFEGIALDVDEQERIVRALGPHKVLILRNHGLLTAGETAAEAFSQMFFLEKACVTQMQILASNQPYRLIPKDVCEHTVKQFGKGGRLSDRAWPALLKQMDALDPSYRN